MKILAKIIENQKIMTKDKANSEVAIINVIKIKNNQLIIQAVAQESTANTVTVYICKNYKT